MSEHKLARLVAHRAQISLRLLVSLRGALHDAGQADLVPILDLVSHHAGDCYTAASQILLARRSAKRLRILAGLGRLSRLGGPRARIVINRLAEDIANPSGGFPAFRPGD